MTNSNTPFFKVIKAEPAYDNGDQWGVLNIRTNRIIKTCKHGSKAAAYVRLYTEQQIEAQEQWEEWEAQ